MKTGILLINLGTPDAPRTREVRAYLKEFFASRRILDINPVWRWFLVNLLILPFRPRLSAKAYQQIWLEDGSPFLVHSLQLKNSLTEQFAAENIPVELGMQCGNPSLKSSLERLRRLECNNIIVLPLYPQYASSTYGSAIEELYKEIINDWNIPFLQIIPPFYSDPRFITAWTKVGSAYLENEPDHVLFSFHSLPLRHLQKSHSSKTFCKNENGCCLELVNENRNCYSAQCYQTAKLIAENLNLEENKWSVSFQSRLGRTEWIKPYTETHLRQLAERGVKKALVFCPSFVTDNLETLEEIGIRAAVHFRQYGGEELKLVPSLNNNPEWVEALSSIIRQKLAC
ncbi:MAG: ferrochelatase [SAR324 cluster bacterium]|nr:ferrochelatase [SAR324 cluster bacterium]MBL7034984.1 ferrochelatase [SAR324 cluster bacterium]